MAVVYIVLLAVYSGIHHREIITASQWKMSIVMCVGCIVALLSVILHITRCASPLACDRRTGAGTKSSAQLGAASKECPLFDPQTIMWCHFVPPMVCLSDSGQITYVTLFLFFVFLFAFIDLDEDGNDDRVRHRRHQKELADGVREGPPKRKSSNSNNSNSSSVIII